MTDRYLDQVADGLRGAVGFYLDEVCRAHPSLTPIEKGVLCSLIGFRFIDPRIRFKDLNDDDRIIADADITVHIQYPVASYRVDFAVEVSMTLNSKTMREWIAVECDGYDWHHKTREQVTRDKAREREIVAAGFKILRFSGTEIHRDCTDAAFQIHKLAVAIIDGWRAPE